MPAPVSVVRSTPTSSGLYDVLDLILDKGLVIDAYVRVSVVGIELLTIDLRVVIASVDTYLRFAEAVDRLVLHEQGGKGLDDLMDSNGNGQEESRRDERRAVGSGDGDGDGSVRSALERVRDAVGGEDDDDDKSTVKKIRKAVSGKKNDSRDESEE